MTEQNKQQARLSGLSITLICIFFVLWSSSMLTLFFPISYWEACLNAIMFVLSVFLGAQLGKRK